MARQFQQEMIEFNQTYSPQDQAKMLLFMMGIDDTDTRHADSEVIKHTLVSIMLSEDFGRFLRYLRR